MVYEITSTYIYVADPAKGYIRYSFDEFEQRWYLSGEQMGVIMTFEPIEDSHKNFKHQKFQGAMARNRKGIERRNAENGQKIWPIE